ncbi:MAG: response regulator [Proteobacteria bacterium]|nr:response regulator [Pseudomonadota bacterium]
MAGEQILVVEDQRAVAGALQMRLRGLGYAVLGVAKDGLEAIQKATELHPDLILMDIKLGDGMDGIEAAHQIRSQLDIPVVYVSAYVDQKLLERARQTHPAGFINKPFTTKDLLTAIDLALFQRKDRDLGLTLDPSTTERRNENKDAVVTADVEGRVNFVSKSAEILLGWRRKQLVGSPLFEVLADVYSLDHDAAIAIVQKVITLGNEEQLLRNKENQGVGELDLLTPLRDMQGQSFGAALKFSSLAAGNVSSGQTKALAAAIDALPVGIAIVSEDMTVEHLNVYAKEILKHNRGLDFTNNRLSARDRQLDEKLRKLVSAAAAKAREGIEDGSDAMFIKAPMIRDQVEVIATPVASGRRSDEAACVILYLFDASLGRQVSHDVLTRLYGLTQTEGKLVQLLVGGLTLDDAATRLEISVNTARTHLKHVFHKTGINRQAELVHRIETGPAGLLVSFNDGH